MRVLVLGDLASPHSLRWAEAMAGRGHEVQRVGFGLPAPSALPTVELGPRELSNRRYVTGLPAWRRAARRFAPDVVHAHFVSSYGLMAMLTSAGAPVIQFAWGSDILWMDRQPPPQRRLLARALRRAATVVVDADQVGSRVAALSPSTPCLQVVFGPDRSWTEAPRHPGRRILSPRGLKPFYNVAAIVAAFVALAPAFPDWQLDVLTGGEDPAQLAAVVTQAALADRVRFRPRLSRSDLQACFLAAEVVCSVPDSDATSVALLEGMASGAFPIVSDLPANLAWVTDEVNGLVVRPGDVGELVDALHRAIDDPELRAAASVANRALIAARGTWEQAVDAVDACTRQVSDAARRR